MIRQYKDLILQAYEAFNQRDIALVLTLMHDQVSWPNEWKGGRLTGPAELNRYWANQFQAINPTITPVSVRERKNGDIEVQVHQFVKDLAGSVLSDTHVLHIYTMQDGLIRTMEVEHVHELA